MRKAIVMEVNKRKAVVMTKDGVFKKVSLRQYPGIELGEEMILQEQRPVVVFSKPVLYTVSAAMIFLMMTISFLTYQSQQLVAAYISIDINPSIEVGVNEDYKVVEVEAINPDAEKLLSKLEKPRGQDFDEFLSHVMEASEEAGYLEMNKDVLIASTVVKKEVSNKVADSVKRSLEELNQKVSTEVNFTAVEVKTDERQEAKKQGVSSGKYKVFLESPNQNSELSIEEVKNSSVTELYEKVNKGQEKINKGQEKKDEMKKKQNEQGKGKKVGNPNSERHGKQEKSQIKKDKELEKEQRKSDKQEKKVEKQKEKQNENPQNQNRKEKDNKGKQAEKEEKRNVPNKENKVQLNQKGQKEANKQESKGNNGKGPNNNGNKDRD